MVRSVELVLDVGAVSFKTLLEVLESLEGRVVTVVMVDVVHILIFAAAKVDLLVQLIVSGEVIVVFDIFIGVELKMSVIVIVEPPESRTSYDVSAEWLVFVLVRLAKRHVCENAAVRVTEEGGILIVDTVILTEVGHKIVCDEVNSQVAL